MRKKGTAAATERARQAVSVAFERLMLQDYAPAAAVTNARGNVICVAGQSGRYLQSPVGGLTTSVLEMGHAAIRIEVRTALQAAVRSGAKVVRNVHVGVGDTPRRMKITVRPLPGIKDEQLFVIILDDRSGSDGDVESGERVAGGPENASAMERLDSELRTVRAELRATVEELETTNAELTASNEEMQLTNEELRSSQDELSALNEELTTVNAALSRKVDELGQVNSDLTNFFASTDMATVFVDPALRIQKFTPTARTLIRLIAADIGRPLSDLAHGFVDLDLTAAVREVLSTQQPTERQVETIDGQAWYLLRIRPYRTAENATAGAVVTLADVSRIKHFEAELQQAKAYAEGIVETLPEPVLILTSDLKVQFATAAFYRHFGVRPEETQGRSVYDLGNGQWNIPSLRKLLENILLHNSSFDSYEVDHVFEGLGRRIMQIKGRRLEHQQLILLAISDVTVRQLAAAALKKSEAQLEEAQRTGRTGSWEWDLKTGDLRWSRELYVIYGLDPKRFVPTISNARELVHPDHRDIREARIAEVVAAKRTSTEFDFCIVSDGSPHFMRCTAKVTRLDEDGRPWLVTGVCQDITERKRTEEALRAANVRLEEADKSKNEFMAMLAHELRNPLAPIRACLYILDHAPKDGQEARRVQAIIERQIVHLTRLVDDLLDVSRIDRRAVVLQRELLDLSELVRSTAEDHRRAFVEGQIELEVSTAPVEAWVKGDRIRLAQVVGNLLGNAVKFTQPGGRTTVTVEADAARSQAVVRVQDTGRGIAPQMLIRIFDPFTQVDVTIDRKKGGLGLGLSVVKGLVEMHDGAVDAASEGPGKGAIFTVKLPLETVAPVESRQRVEDAHSNPTLRRVLVIEDNVDAADSIGQALTMVGHAVEVAHSGPEGIEKARKFGPEIVLCDIGLPEMDGYDVARAMRAEPTLVRVRLIALTGYAGPDDIAKAKAAGFDAHVAKPPTMAMLERVLQARS